jgi:beta-lactamase regulating signal transducer with metallopeptidase domain
VIEAVLNWIAQGLAVAVAAAVGLRLLGPARAHARYLTYWAALWVIVCLPVVPLLWAAQPSAIAGSVGRAAASGLVPVPQAAWNTPTVLGSLAALWVGSRLARLGAAVLALGRARRRCRALPAGVFACLEPSTKERLSHAGILLATSPDVRAAAVLGLGSPIIAVHPALLAQLTSSQLDQVVVHEWAHVVRKDARATLVQQVLRALVGWHPAVWWTNRQIHLEREIACDEMVVAVTGAPRAYAACLTYLATLTRAPREAQLAVGAVGASGLRRRVLQVLARDQRPTGARRLANPALVALLVALAVWVGNVRMFGPALASVALLEAKSLVALASAVQAPGIITPAHPVVQTPVPAVAPRVAPVRREGGTPVAAPTGPAPRHQTAGGATGAPTPDVAAAPRQDALPSELLPAASVPMVTGLLQAPGGHAASTPPRSPTEAVNVWNAATNAGGQIGRTSQKGAVTTAGFFTRVAKNVARSF